MKGRNIFATVFSFQARIVILTADYPEISQVDIFAKNINSS
jgi:hypothetical protein